MIYSVPYVLLIIFYGILAIYYQGQRDETIKLYTRVVCAAVLIFFFGLRGFTCDDWINYYPAFQKCTYEDVNINIFAFRNIQWHMEPGFTLLMCVCKSIVPNFHFFVFVCTCINTALLFCFFRKRVENIPLAIVLYLCFYGYLMSTNLMRNSIAILIFVNAVSFIESRKALPYFALCVLALSFHISSLLYFPLFFIFNIKTNKWIYLSLFIVGNVVFLFHIPVFLKIAAMLLGDTDGKLQVMVESYTSGNLAEAKAISIGYMERLFTGILVFCYYESLILMRKENIIFINSFLTYILLSFFLSEFGELSLRTSSLFSFAYWILWGDLIRCFSIENNRKLFMGFMTIYCILKMIGTTNMITSEYDNVLFGAKSYEERLYIHNRYSKN